MRLFEIVLTWSLILFGACLVFGGSRRIAGFAAFIVLASALSHMWKEGARLQAIPLYAAAASMLLWFFLHVSGSVRISFGIILIAVTCTGAYACYVYPVFRLPETSGSYSVGTFRCSWTDEARVEKFGARASSKRAIVAQVWYPASTCSGKTAVYRDPETLTWRSAHLRYVRTHACEDAPFSAAVERAPVLLFSPSSGGNRNQNTFLAEEFASLGYIFIAFDHANTSSRILWTDGSIIPSLPDVWLNLSSFAALKESTPKTEAILADNVKDMQYALDQLFNNQGNDPNFRSIAVHSDPARVAAIGHSFGGAAAAELCRIDTRVRTGLNLDGWMFSGVNRQGVGKPFLFMIEDDPHWTGLSVPVQHTDHPVWRDNEADIGDMGNQQFYASIQNSLKSSGGCVARVIGSDHGSFADLGQYTRTLGRTRTPVTEIQHSVTLLLKAFLEANLNNDVRAMRQLIDSRNQILDLHCLTLS